MKNKLWRKLASLLWLAVTGGTLCLASEGPLTISPPPNESEDIPPLRPEAGELPPGTWEKGGPWFIAAAVLSLSAAALGCWLLLRPKQPVVVPPHDKALRFLEELKKEPDRPQKVSEAARILRAYLAESFHLPPSEMTTREFCEVLDQHPQTGTTLKTKVQEFLQRCDEWSFSDSPPRGAENAVQGALALVEAGENRLGELKKAAAETGTRAVSGKAPDA